MASPLSQVPSAPDQRSALPRRTFMGTLLAASGVLTTVSAWAGEAPLPPVEVFKNPSCGCCTAWVEHLRASGFTVKVTPVEDTRLARKRLGMPDELGGCHTAVLAAYVLEGHVPAFEAKRLLRERPADALGLAVPGMPAGAPGMEMGSQAEPFDVMLVNKTGVARVFAHYPKPGTV